MASANKVILIGNLTRDPEIRYTPKGSAVADIGLAVNRFYTTDSGERREETTFVDVTLWGRTAEIAGQYCKKGRPLYVEGRLQMDTWDDKASGQKRSKLKVVADNIQLLGGRDDNGGSGSNQGGGGGNSDAGGNTGNQGGGGGTPQPPESSPAPAASSSSDNDGAQFDTQIDDDDDIPF
jgi:single-strand DNA-binding protein